ncbi:MAG TPA: hypothetical protein VIV11_17525 [Kofleriaceae bacterium]
MRTLVLVLTLGCGGSQQAVTPAAPAEQPPASTPEPAEPSTTTGDPATRRNATVVPGDQATLAALPKEVVDAQKRAATLAWQAYGPDRRFALVSGSLESGAFAALVEVKAGSAAFWHMHGKDVRIVVLAGIVEYLESGQPTHTLAPGSSVLQPGGYKHSESCKAGSDCLLYVHGDRGFDVKPL